MQQGTCGRRSGRGQECAIQIEPAGEQYRLPGPTEWLGADDDLRCRDVLTAVFEASGTRGLRRPPAVIYVGIGANLPGADGAPPIETCRRAVTCLGDLPGLRLLALSSWYATAPIPRAAQPDYINGVAALDGVVAPHAFLSALQEIETMFGRCRVPGEANAARTLDLDIIDHDGAIHDGADLILPHPRAHLRAFVLHPLAEIAPDWVHPIMRRAVATLVAALPPQEIRRCPPDRLWPGRTS